MLFSARLPLIKYSYFSTSINLIYDYPKKWLPAIGNYTFATIVGNGLPVVNNTTRLSQAATKAKQNNAKIMISINGVASDFKNMAATAANPLYDLL
jgi:hypothetical protein